MRPPLNFGLLILDFGSTCTNYDAPKSEIRNHEMNFCILTDKYPPDVGGLAVSTRRLAQGLSRAGHAVCVSVTAMSVAPGVVNASDNDGMTVHRIGSHRRADDTAADWFDHVVALHARHRFDLIHAMYVTQPAFVAVTAARYLGVPSVISARGNDLDRAAFDPGKFSQISFALQNASTVTVVTTDLAHKAAALAPGCLPQFVPNSVDTALFTPGARDETLAASLGLGDAPVIAFVGEARQKKGLTILLPALAQMCAQHNPCPVLLLVGGVRKDDEPILQVFQRQNPALNVRIVPNVPHDQLPVYYRLADVLALPSLRDGMPNALLEGMASGRAIVASNVGGMPDVVRDGENGLLVSPGDVSALADAILNLLADPARRAQLGRAARATVESDFTPERELQRNLEIYQSVRRET
jgi:glycosyltransferase involved in cell wall biosynthesis